MPWHNESTVPRGRHGLCTVNDCEDRRAKTRLRPKSAWQIPWSRGQIPLGEHVTKGAWLGVDPIRSASSQHDPPDAQHRSRSSHYVPSPMRQGTSEHKHPLYYTRNGQFCQQGFFHPTEVCSFLSSFSAERCRGQAYCLILTATTTAAPRHRLRRSSPTETTTLSRSYLVG